MVVVIDEGRVGLDRTKFDPTFSWISHINEQTISSFANTSIYLHVSYIAQLQPSCGY